MNYFYITFKCSKYQIKYTGNVYSLFLVLELTTDKVLKISAATKGSEMHIMKHELSTHDSVLTVQCKVAINVLLKWEFIYSNGCVPKSDFIHTHTSGIYLLDFSSN